MMVVRSILAIVIGWIASSVVTLSIEMTNFFICAPHGEKSLTERIEEIQNDKELAKAFYESLPIGALIAVLVGWALGAFLGGALSALIAGRRRILHAGIIGALVLAGTILNALHLKREYGLAHPDWMILAGLLLPLPMSLVAGKLVSTLFPPPPDPVAPQSPP